jgi:ABC-type transport system involved in multi-copper enzyme maturation permease subunit
MPIFDQGYQHWQGPLSGHAWRWLAISRNGVRVQLKSRILWILIRIAWLPALVLVAAMALWGLVEQKNEGVIAIAAFFWPPQMLVDPAAHRATIWAASYSRFFFVEMIFVMLLVVIAGPGLISRDLRFNALPLYLSRPLTRLDYFMGKLGVIGALIAMVAVGPAVFAYVVGVCFSLDLSVVKDTYMVLLGSIAYGVVVTLTVGTMILAMSSLSSRSLYVGIAWAGLCLISLAVSSILTGMNRQSATVGMMQREMRDWVAEHPPPPGVRMMGHYPQTKWDKGKPQIMVEEPGQQAEAQRWYKEWTAASQAAAMKMGEHENELLRTDWRPLVNFVGNLNRLGDFFLNADKARAEIGRAYQSVPGRGGPNPMRPSQLPPQDNSVELEVANHPWWWSAVVLGCLTGISLCVLTRRVKSLDRLK